MKGVLAATAVVGALAIGGLPALALTLAADESAPEPSVVQRVERAGPPPWAHGHGRDKHAAKDKKAVKDKHALKERWKDEWKDRRGERHGPPPWANGKR